MKYIQMLFITLIATLMLIPDIKAQESIIITGNGIDYGGWQPFSKEAASALFIQEKACIAFPTTTERNVFFIKLTKESALQIGESVIGVVFVNNAGIIRPPLYGNEPVTLEIYPFKKSNIYFCKSYEHKGISQQKSMKMYNDLEQDVARFLESPIPNDTLRQPPGRVDSRYTPLLVKNLSNDSIIYIEYSILSETYYEPVRMSDFARKRLKEIFRPVFWSFDFPKADATAEEWRDWLDELLSDNETRKTRHIAMPAAAETSATSPKAPVGSEAEIWKLNELSTVRQDTKTKL